MGHRLGLVLVVATWACAACKADPVGSGPADDSGPSVTDAADADGADTSLGGDVGPDASETAADAKDTAPETGEVGPDGCPVGTALVPGGSYYEDFFRTTLVIGAFCMAKTETTLAEYKKCNDVGGCTSDGLACSTDATWPDLDAGALDHPINCVSQTQAATYCAYRGGRLPTWGEFEWAARAGAKGWRFPWGNDPVPDAAHACWNLTTTCSTGAFPAGDNPQGIHDLSGGVAEWTSTPYDPAPPEIVLANGSWASNGASDLESTSFVHIVDDDRGTTTGFRCVFTPKP